MRAYFKAFEDKSLPSLVQDAEGEVASIFTRYPLNFIGDGAELGEKAAKQALPKYPSNGTTGAEFGIQREKAESGHKLGEI